jgi:hypothetical protein
MIILQTLDGKGKEEEANNYLFCNDVAAVRCN